MDTCPQFGILADSMERRLRALGGVINMIRSAHESGQDLSIVESENLASLLDLVREEFKNRQSHHLRLLLCE